jgi:hypothetical protein
MRSSGLPQVLQPQPRSGGGQKERVEETRPFQFSRKVLREQALAVPAASEPATAVETPEAATRMAEASDMGDTHAVGETATPKMGDIYAAVGETVTSDMGDTYAAETHAVMGDRPLSAYARVAEAVAKLVVTIGAIRQIAITIVRQVAIVIGLIRRGTAVDRILYGPDWAGVFVGVGLRGSRLRPGKHSRGQPDCASQQHRFGR